MPFFLKSLNWGIFFLLTCLVDACDPFPDSSRRRDWQGRPEQRLADDSRQRPRKETLLIENVQTNRNAKEILERNIAKELRKDGCQVGASPIVGRRTRFLVPIVVILDQISIDLGTNSRAQFYKRLCHRDCAGEECSLQANGVVSCDTSTSNRCVKCQITNHEVQSSKAI